MSLHVLFVSTPGYGHVNPTLPLAAELVRRGHRVSYASGEQARDSVRGVGAEFIDSPFVMPSGPPSGTPSREQLDDLMEMFRKAVEDVYPLLTERFATDKVDVVLGDVMTPVAALVAEKLAVPLIALFPSFASNDNFNLARAADDATDGHKAMFEAFGELARMVAEFAEQEGLQARPGMFDLKAKHNFVMLPRSFQFDGDNFDDSYLFLGPAVTERSDGQWQPADADRPVLLISLGTVFNAQVDFFRTCIEAFADSRWQVVMAVGKHVQESDLGTIPANFEIRAHAPQLEILAHADAFLTHNGMNSTMESLMFGVPMVGVPQMIEQEFNADRVTELGFGRRMGEDLSAEALRSTVEEVSSDPEIRAAVQKMSAEIRGVDGPSLGADAVEKIVAG